MEDVKELDYRKLEEGDVVWACAYKTNNTEKSMALKQKPVQGIIVKNVKPCKYCRNLLYFVPFNAKGNPVKSRAVLVDSRKYAKTEQEATVIYNRYVQRQIDFLQGLVYECKADLI